MNSSGHAANILGDYNYVGVGTDTSSDGTLYVTVVFMKKGETAPPTTEAPPVTEAPPEDTPDTTSPPPDEGGGPAQGRPPPARRQPRLRRRPRRQRRWLCPRTAVVPGQSCIEASRFAQLCHD